MYTSTSGGTTVEKCNMQPVVNQAMGHFSFDVFVQGMLRNTFELSTCVLLSTAVQTAYATLQARVENGVVESIDSVLHQQIATPSRSNASLLLQEREVLIGNAQAAIVALKWTAGDSAQHTSSSYVFVNDTTRTAAWAYLLPPSCLL